MSKKSELENKIEEAKLYLKGLELELWGINLREQREREEKCTEHEWSWIGNTSHDDIEQCVHCKKTRRV